MIYSGVGTPSETVVSTDLEIIPNMTGTGSVGVVQKAISFFKSFTGSAYVEYADDTGGDEQWMDGTMTEEEWWARRRRLRRIPRVRQNWSR